MKNVIVCHFTFLFLGFIFNHVQAQSFGDDIQVGIKKEENYKAARENKGSFVEFKVVDKLTNEIILSKRVIFYLDRLAITNISSDVNFILLNKGKHKINIRCAGYKNSKILKLKVKPGNFYHITFYLTQTDEMLF